MPSPRASQHGAETRAAAECIVQLRDIVRQTAEATTGAIRPGRGPLGDDVAALKRPGRTDEMALYHDWFIKSVLTRCDHVADALTGVGLLILAEQTNARTTFSHTVLARTVLETGAMTYYQVADDLNERLLRAYASALGENALALQAIGAVDPVKGAGTRDRILQDYLSLRSKGPALGILLVEGRGQVAGHPRVTAVRRDGREAQVEPNVTAIMKELGQPFEFSWRLGSGVGHGRIWAVQGSHDNALAGNENLDDLQSAALIALQGTQVLVQTLAAYADAPELVEALARTMRRLADVFRSVGN